MGLQKLVIIGAGGLGSEILWVVGNINSKRPTFEVIGFCDDAANRKGQAFQGRTILGSAEEVDCTLSEKPAFICAIGNNKFRKTIVARLVALRWTPATIVDPSAAVADSAEIGPGSYVAPGCVLSVDIRIGAHSVLNLGCSIGHNGALEDYSQISPGARVSGFSTVKEGAFLGSNAVIAPKVTVGAWATLGACSFATHNIPDGATAIGNPARVIFQKQPTS